MQKKYCDHWKTWIASLGAIPSFATGWHPFPLGGCYPSDFKKYIAINIHTFFNNFNQKMPSDITITPLIGGNYYHIFNRGINSNTVFFIPKNYDYFLSLWKKYISCYVEVLSYCLLSNHFHFLIKIRDTIETVATNGEIEIVDNRDKIGQLVSEQLRRLFISYAQAINRQEKRTGGLFVRNFKRIEIMEDSHLEYLFFYIHHNPVKHGFSVDFKTYKYSSYNAYVLNKPTSISKMHGLSLFGGLEDFINFHNYYHEEKNNLNLE